MYGFESNRNSPASYIVDDNPRHSRFSPVAWVVIFIFVILAVYSLLFWWFASTSIARPYPTEYTNFWYGWLHGFFTPGAFVLSWFNGDVTIYQSPNSGFWYNLGFLTGAGIILGGASRSI